MIAAWVIALSFLSQSTATIRMPTDAEMRREDVTAEYITAPVGVEVGKFAHDTVVESGLEQWDGSLPTAEIARDGYHVVSVLSGGGRVIRVIYRPETNATNICVIRGSSNGTGPAAYRAKRWCASKFGIELEEVPPPFLL